MQVTLGPDGCSKSYQAEFPGKTECVYCRGNSQIAFVAHEGFDGEEVKKSVRSIKNTHFGLWPHDYCSVAIYLCRACLKPTAIFNQA